MRWLFTGIIPRQHGLREKRLADMNSLGVDVPVLSTNAYFYN
ncbi:MAG: hypothetical protein Ct9H300mP11_32300 [Chloroflexota bacterium]|nr:MAG: hypothetical protein Ct9H300mP11_32300 [Chloroflexota bacterium]